MLPSAKPLLDQGCVGRCRAHAKVDHRLQGDELHRKVRELGQQAVVGDFRILHLLAQRAEPRLEVVQRGGYLPGEGEAERGLVAVVAEFLETLDKP